MPRVVLDYTSFVSSDRDILESIPTSERATNVTDMDLAFDDLPLGIQ